MVVVMYIRVCVLQESSEVCFYDNLSKEAKEKKKCKSGLEGVV